MKVKEFVSELLKLDQEKDLWVFYDRYAALTPAIHVADAEIAESSGKMTEGDYYFDAW